VVVGLPDARWGQAVTAFVVAAEGVSPQAAVAGLRRYGREASGLPGMKLPKRVVAIEAIPKSAVGKILRRTLTAGDYTALAEADSERTPA
jgi:2-furoate---CoA ligase